MTELVHVLVLSAALFTFVVFGASPAETQAVPGKDPAVFANTALTSDAGRTVHLSDFRGKVVFVNFWGSWCLPCDREMPSIRVMQSALQDRASDIEYVFISTKTATSTRTSLNSANWVWPGTLKNGNRARMLSARFSSVTRRAGPIFMCRRLTCSRRQRRADACHGCCMGNPCR